MQNFEGKFVLLRDGNYSPKESWHTKPKGLKFSVGFVTSIEEIDEEILKNLLLEAAASGYRYAELLFRYHRETSALLRCDAFLDTFFFPLRHQKIIGTACPLVTTDGYGCWLVELFNNDDVPLAEQVFLTPEKLLDMIFSPSGEGINTVRKLH